MNSNFLIRHLPEFFKQKNNLTTTDTVSKDFTTKNKFIATSKKIKSLTKNIQIPNKIDVFGKKITEESSRNLRKHNSKTLRQGSKRRYHINNKQSENQINSLKLSEKRNRLEKQSRLEITKVWLENKVPEEEELQDTEIRSVGRRREIFAKLHTHKIFEPLWWIPFSYSFGESNSSSGETSREFWLRNQTLRFVDVGMSSKEYFLANPHWIYPYRVNYDFENWKMIISQVYFKKIIYFFLTVI